MIQIHPAKAEDQKTITRIIRAVGINRMSLDWQRFLVAEDNGQIVGIGQIKPHGDGSRELASIAVIPERQGQGIARAIIEELIARDTETGPLYLTCRSQLEPFYARFGFRRIERDEMTRYFRRIMWFANILTRFVRDVRIIVMKRD